jgi:DNA-binding CsgD family transcriptional regulator
MHHLLIAQGRAAFDFLWRLRGATDRAAFVAAVLDGLRNLIPCELATYNEVDPASRTISTVALPASVLPPEGTTPVTRHYRDHPLLLHQLQTGDGSPRRITDMTSMRIFSGTALFSDLYRPARIRWEIAMTLPASHGTIRCVALNRAGRDFSERDLDLLQLVRPYLLDAQRQVDAASDVRLNPRERDVLALVASGKTNREVGAVLSISPRTVQKHLEHVYDKLGIRRRAGAATRANAQHPVTHPRET